VKIRRGAGSSATRAVHRVLAGAWRTLEQDPLLRSAAAAASVAAVAVVALLVHEALRIPASAAETLFVIVHPLHVLVGSLTIVRMLVRDVRMTKLPAAMIGYPLAIVIVTITDSLLPFLAELLLALPSRHVHYGFVEYWWIVHPLAAAGILIGLRAPRVQLPRPAILAASALPPLYDMMMAMWRPLDAVSVITVFVFVAASVWLYLAGTACAVALLTSRHGAGPALDRAIARYLDEVQGRYRQGWDRR
jgi:hypothetical protein